MPFQVIGVVSIGTEITENFSSSMTVFNCVDDFLLALIESLFFIASKIDDFRSSKNFQQNGGRSTATTKYFSFGSKQGTISDIFFVVYNLLGKVSF